MQHAVSQSLHCLHTQSKEVDEGSEHKLDLRDSFAILERGPRTFEIGKISVVNP